MKPASLPMRTDEAFAQQQDAADPLRGLRLEFVFPIQKNGDPVTYFCGNSLGLMPRKAAQYVDAEVRAWDPVADGAGCSRTLPGASPRLCLPK